MLPAWKQLVSNSSSSSDLIYSYLDKCPSTKASTYREILKAQDLKKSKFKGKGLILVWPQNKRKGATVYHNELIWFTWLLAQTLYYAHLFSLLPSGAALAFEQPKWKYKTPLYKPTRIDYIIEPDWGSGNKNCI